MITTTLAETVSLLEVDHFGIEEYTSSINSRHFKTLREILLDLWGHLLDMLERMEESDASHFYKAILLIIRRYLLHLFISLKKKGGNLIVAIYLLM